MEPQGPSMGGSLDHGLPPPALHLFRESYLLLTCLQVRLQGVRLQFRLQGVDLVGRSANSGLSKNTLRSPNDTNTLTYSNSVREKKKFLPHKCRAVPSPSVEVNEIICSHFPIIASHCCHLSYVPSSYNPLDTCGSSRTFSHLSTEFLGSSDHCSHLKVPRTSAPFK